MDLLNMTNKAQIHEFYKKVKTEDILILIDCLSKMIY